MTLASRLFDLTSAIGADIKGLRMRLANVEGGSNSPVPMINAATRLIQTQRIIAAQTFRGQVP